MNKAGLILIGLGLSVLGGGFYFIKTLPDRYYQKALYGEKNKFFYLGNMNQQWLEPGKVIKIPQASEQLSELWHSFQLKNVIVPLPVRHPSYSTQVLFPSKKGNEGFIGISFRSPNKRLTNKLMLFDPVIFNSQSEEHFLFQIPLAQNIIATLDDTKVWNDLFTKDLKKPAPSIEEKVYNLYLLNIRSHFFPKKFVDIGILEGEEKAIFKLDGLNKDYLTEVYFTLYRGSLYSFGLVSEKNNPDAEVIRNKIIHDSAFQPSDPAFTQMIYREFKALSFNRQTDQEGMLYLFSSWSHQMTNQGLIQEMVAFLERGSDNKENLKNLYEYSFENFQTTFSTRDVGIEDLSGEIKLQLSIDWEKLKQLKSIGQESKEIDPLSLMSPKEKMNHYLDKTKDQVKQAPGKVKFD
jgi:hypothetical protein